MNDQAAMETLAEVERVRVRTRRTMGWGTLAFLVFGVATLLSAPFTRIGDGLALGIYWLVVGPAAVAFTLVTVRRREMASGLVDRNEYLYAIVIAAMVAAAIVVGWATRGATSDVAPLFAIGGGLLLIALIDRSAVIAASGALIVLLGAGLAVAAPANADTWAALGEGLILVGTGVWIRIRESHPLDAPASATTGARP